MKTGLILIDIQVGLDEVDYYGGERSQPNAEINCQSILETFRNKELPIFHVKHNSINEASPLHPSKVGNLIKKEVAPISPEPLYEKSVNSAFIGTSLTSDLQKQEVKQLIIVGLTVEHCISTSVRMSANLGFHTILVEDATAAFAKKREERTISADTVHAVSIANLEGEFAKIIDTATLIHQIQGNILDFK